MSSDCWECPSCGGKGFIKGVRCGLCMGVGELSQEDWEQHCDDLWWEAFSSIAHLQSLTQHSPIGGGHGHNV